MDKPQAVRRKSFGLFKKSPPSSQDHGSRPLLFDLSEDFYFQLPLLRPVENQQPSSSTTASTSKPRYMRVGYIFVHFKGGQPVRQIEMHKDKAPQIQIGICLFFDTASVDLCVDVKKEKYCRGETWWECIVQQYWRERYVSLSNTVFLYVKTNRLRFKDDLIIFLFPSYVS